MGSDIFIFDKSDIFDEVESVILCYAKSEIVCYANSYGKIYKYARNFFQQEKISLVRKDKYHSTLAVRQISLYKIKHASPNEKNRYFSSTAVL